MNRAGRFLLIGLSLAGCTLPGAGGKYADDGPAPLVMPAYPARRRSLTNEATTLPQRLPTDIIELPEQPSTTGQMPVFPTPPQRRLSANPAPGNTSEPVPPPRSER